jgi:Fanconi anemia group M protein
MGLDQFMSSVPSPAADQKEHSIQPAEPQASISGPVLDGFAHREREQLAAAAASASITELQGDAGQASIILDHRESKSTLGPYIKSMGASVTFKHLTTGDVRLSDRVLIERKTARDLVQSLSDGRLLHQCRRLNAAALRPLLLIEIGEGHGQAVHPDAVHGALAYISLDLGIPVMMTKNAEETARFLVAAARREHDLMEHWAYRAMQRVAPHQDVKAVERATSAAAAEIKAIELGAAQSSPLAQRWPAHAIEEQTAVLAAIDGVGQSKAKALIEAFGNLSSVFSATPEAMSEVKTIGPVTAMNVHQVLHGV